MALEPLPVVEAITVSFGSNARVGSILHRIRGLGVVGVGFPTRPDPEPTREHSRFDGRAELASNVRVDGSAGNVIG